MRGTKVDAMILMQDCLDTGTPTAIKIQKDLDKKYRKTWIKKQPRYNYGMTISVRLL